MRFGHLTPRDQSPRRKIEQDGPRRNSSFALGERFGELSLLTDDCVSKRKIQYFSTAILGAMQNGCSPKYDMGFSYSQRIEDSPTLRALG
jgi:hypothetical protein